MEINSIIIGVLAIQCFVFAFIILRIRRKVNHYASRAFKAEKQIDEEERERKRLAEKAGLNAEELENWFNSYKKGELAHVRTDKFGNKWYAFADPKMLPPRRGLLAELAGNYADMNMTRESLMGYIKRMKENANTGNITKMFSDLERMEERVTWACEEETLMHYAKIYFMLEGEPVDLNERNPEMDKRKDKILRDDYETRDFFLYRAFILTKHYSEISEEDFLQYLATLRIRKEKEHTTMKIPSNKE